MKKIALVLLAATFSLNAFASGTFLPPPPPPKAKVSGKLDCSGVKAKSPKCKALKGKK